MNIKYIKIIIGCFITCVSVSSCYAGSNLQNSISAKCVELRSPETKNIVNHFIIDAFKPTLVRLGNNEAYLVRRFGKYKVISKKITLPAFREPGEPDYKELHETWGFDGIILSVESEFPKPAKDNNPYIIKKITITKNIYQLKLPINIGSTKEDFLCQLGAPQNEDVEESKKLSYSTWGARENGNLTVVLDSNFTAKKIILEYYSD